MLWHRGAGEAPRSPQDRRPEVHQLGQMVVPVVYVPLEDRPQHLVLPHAGVEAVHELRHLGFGAEVASRQVALGDGWLRWTHKIYRI